MPDRLQQNLMYHGKYMTRPPSFSKSSCRWSKIFVVFNTHSSRHSSLVTFDIIMSTLHTFLLSSVAFYSEITKTFCPSECPAECCCDLGVECWMLFWSSAWGMLLWLYDEKLSTNERRFQSALWLVDISYDNRSTVNRSHRKLKVGMTEPP